MFITPGDRPRKPRGRQAIHRSVEHTRRGDLADRQRGDECSFRSLGHTRTRMFDLPNATDADVREATGPGFPKHPLHKIVCIGGLVASRQPEGWRVRSGSPICGAGQRLGGLSRSCSAETGLATRAYAFTALIFDKAAPRVCRAGAVNNEIFLAFPAAHELFCSDTYFRVAFPAHHWWVARQVLDLCGDHLVFDHPVFIGGRMAHFCDDMARIAPCEAYKKRGWNQGGKS